MYDLGINTTVKECVGLGQTDEEGKKFAKFHEIVEKVNVARTNLTSQCEYPDYVQLLKVYDKHSKGTMMLAELDNILSDIGDEVPKEHIKDQILKICVLKKDGY